MFKDDEQSTDKTARLKENGVVVATNFWDLWDKTKDLDEFNNIIADGYRIRGLLKKWGKGEDWSKELTGKKVLDIAAGSTLSRDFIQNWLPHFARLCAVNGAAVTVVDINPQGGIDKELFDECLEANLVSVIMGEGLDRYQSLLNRKFDVISSANFVGNMPENLQSVLSRRKIPRKTFEDRLVKQASELLAEDGIMCLGLKDSKGNLIYYTKKEGELKPVLEL